MMILDGQIHNSSSYTPYCRTWWKREEVQGGDLGDFLYCPGDALALGTTLKLRFGRAETKKVKLYTVTIYYRTW